MRRLSAALVNRALITEGRTQAAYRTYIEHAQGCRECTPGHRCPTGDPLWRTYSATGDVSPSS